MLRGSIIYMLDRHTGLEWYAPDIALSLRVFNQKAFQNIRGNITDAIRTNSRRNQLHLFNVFYSTFLQTWRSSKSFDDESRKVCSYARTSFTPDRVSHPNRRNLRKIK